METYAPKGSIHGPILPEFILEKTITLGAKIMYALLCDYASKKDYCWPSQDTLADRLSCSVSSIKNYLTELVKENLVAVRKERRDGRRLTTYYYMLRPDVSDFQKQEAAQRRPEDPQSHQPQSIPQQPKSDPIEPNFDCNQPNSGYRTTLKNQEKENTPPLPPMRPEQPKVSPAPKAPAAGGVSVFSPDFEKAWELYPKKENRGFAWSAWRKLKRCGQLPPLEDILDFIRRFAGSENWQKENGRFIPQFSRWLHGQRWLDPVPVAEAKEMRRRQELHQALQAQEEREKRLQEQRNAEKARVRPLFDAFAAKFTEPRNEGQNAMALGTWMHLRSINAAPLASDVPADNALPIIEFMNAFKRQRREARYRATHEEPHTIRPVASAAEPASCGDILRNHPIFARLFPENQQLQQAV